MEINMCNLALRLSRDPSLGGFYRKHLTKRKQAVIIAVIQYSCRGADEIRLRVACSLTLNLIRIMPAEGEIGLLADHNRCFCRPGRGVFYFADKITFRRMRNVSQIIIEKEVFVMFDTSVAIQVLPSVNSDEEVIRVVDEVIAYIKSFGLHTVVAPFETTVEGDYDTLMEIVKGCQLIAVKAGAPGVSTYVKIAYRPEKGVMTIDQKISKYQK